MQFDEMKNDDELFLQTHNENIATNLRTSSAFYCTLLSSF